MTTEESIWEQVEECNRAWLQGEPQKVGGLFHPGVVMALPNREPVRGRDAMVQTYVDYCNQVRTEAFEVLDHSVDVLTDVAVVSYGFSVRYRTEGETFNERGREVLVFRPSGDTWLAVWRTQLPAPDAATVKK